MTQFANHYLDPRILRIFCLGIASGLPWVAIGSVLTLWLQDAGLTRSSIGYAGIIFAVYSINFLWSPLIDRASIPWLGKLGQRKSWLLLSQSAIVLACLLTAATDPTLNAKITVLFCLLIALASASQDIVIDAFRIESVLDNGNHDDNLLAAGAAMATAGWWTGFAGLGAIALWLKDTAAIDWSTIYLGFAALFTLIAAGLLSFPEPRRAPNHEQAENGNASRMLTTIVSLSRLEKASILLLLLLPFAIATWALFGSYGMPDAVSSSALYIPSLILASVLSLVLAIVRLAKNNRQAELLSHNSMPLSSRLDQLLYRVVQSVVSPLTEFFSGHGAKLALRLLAFIVLFKIGEAFLGRMSIVFYKEIGFSNTDIAAYSKLGSWLVTVVFSVISGWFTIKYGIVRGLLIAGVAMAASNLMFSIMAVLGPMKWFFGLTILVDGFTSAWSSVAFVAFISSLCDRRFTATHYALLASLGTLGRTLFASSSGQMVDVLNGNWALFFMLTALMVVPSLLLLIKASHQFNQTLLTKTNA